MLTQTPQSFDDWWNVPETWIETPNQRRNGWSGMIRATIEGQTFFIKKQCNHLYRSCQHPFGQPTVNREFENITTLTRIGVCVPEPVFHGTRKTDDGYQGLLVTRELSGFSALGDQTNLDPTQRETLAREIGRVLGLVHKHGLQHSCLYDKHIMIRWQNATPEIALIDLEKMRRRILPRQAAKHDLEQLHRRQSIWSEQEWRILEQAHRAPC